MMKTVHAPAMRERRLSSGLIRLLAVVLLALLVSLKLASAAWAAGPYVVNSAADTHDITPGDGICADSTGSCTLRAAVEELQASGVSDSITFELTYPATITLTDIGPLPDFDASLTEEDVVIQGPGSDKLTIDAAGLFRHFFFGGRLRSVTVSGVTLANGYESVDGGSILNQTQLDLSDVAFVGNDAAGNGGALASLGGNVSLDHVTLSNNTSANNGGAIYIIAGSLDVTASAVSANTSSGSGGGIFGDGGFSVINVDSSVLSGNSAVGDAGGIANNGTLTVTHTTLSGNEATGEGSRGGGIYSNAAGWLAVSGSTFSGNSGYFGGGLYVDAGPANVSHSTLFANSGGGIVQAGGGITLTHTTVANSTLAGDCVGTVDSDGYNLASDATCIFFDLPGDLQSTNPSLGALQYNGGPVAGAVAGQSLLTTHSPQAGSPAIDAGNPDFAPPPLYDQRGSDFPRVANGTIDIGALEVTHNLVVTNTADGGPGSLRQAILNANAIVNEGGADLISFNIPGAGVHTIQPASPLPTITDGVLIDGYTQPGASPNTLSSGDNAVLKIELDGSAAGSSDGLSLQASDSTVRGLVINRFSQAGIVVQGFSNTVAGNFIGTDPTGTIGRGNGRDGVYVTSSISHTIGGPTPDARNLISDNGNGDPQNPGNGITLRGVSDVHVSGNIIGADAAGNAALGNHQDGVHISLGGSGDIIGGDSANLISANARDGIYIGDDAESSGHMVQGNWIGTDASGTGMLGNGRNGVTVLPWAT